MIKINIIKQKKISLLLIFFALFQCLTNIIAQDLNAWKTNWPTNFELIYSSIKQPDDSILDENRTQFNITNDLLNIFPCLQLITIEKTGNRPGVCYHFAMRETLGLSKEQFKHIERYIYGMQDWVTIIGMPYNFFNQTKKPIPGGLATYTRNDNIFYIRHFGVIVGKNQIKSKIGTSDYTFQHEYWDVPIKYGNNICFWQLQEIYRTTEGKILLFDRIMSIIQRSSLPQIIKDYQKFLFALIDRKINVSKDDDLKDNNQSVYYLLKSCMGIQINFCYANGITPLICAIYNKQKYFIELLLEHNADVNIPDINGNTPLMYAVHSKKKDIIILLLKYNPLINTKNQYNETALKLAHYGSDIMIMLLNHGADIADIYDW
ncbi:MAG TPA: ankyrin repeat domain-containing protein [Candidatus Babeliales bacterium]|nr:ankyrin repeat domain-containing protein [Candidatus Babeliales bacterium]